MNVCRRVDTKAAHAFHNTYCSLIDNYKLDIRCRCESQYGDGFYMQIVFGIGHESDVTTFPKVSGVCLMVQSIVNLPPDAMKSKLGG
jgi:hypothetical protein